MMPGGAYEKHGLDFRFSYLLLQRPAMEAVAAETQPQDATRVLDGSAGGLIMR